MHTSYKLHAKVTLNFGIAWALLLCGVAESVGAQH